MELFGAKVTNRAGLWNNGGGGWGGAGEGRGRGCSEDLKGHLAMQLFLPSVLKYKIFFIANDLKTLTRLDETANVIS